MTQRYRKFQRNWGMWYAFDNAAGNSVRLKTRIKTEAVQKVNAMNETERQPLCQDEGRTGQNAGNYGGGVSASGRKKVWEPKKASEPPLCQRKAEGGLENGLANLWRRKRITKRAHAVREQEIKWEIPVKL
jgi:hypothetical protein